MERHYIKIPNYNIFTPKLARIHSNSLIKTKKNINYNQPKTTKYGSKTFSEFYANKNNPLINSHIILATPRRNIFQNIIRNIESNSNTKNKKKNLSFHKILPFVIRKIGKRNQPQNSCIEAENLFHETYQLKKVIKQLEKKLSHLSHDNLIRDKTLNATERQIKNIIFSNEFFDKSFIYEYKDKDLKDENKDNINDLNMNNISTSMGVLILKIKKEIKSINNNIKHENNKIRYLKKTTYATKMREFKIESEILNQHLNKINSFKDNAFEIKKSNKLSMLEYKKLKGNISTQEMILSNLDNDCKSLEIRERLLNNDYKRIKRELQLKKEKQKLNDKELNILSIKNKNLINDSLIKSTSYIVKNNGSPISIKRLYQNKLSELKKNINFYKGQCKFSDELIEKLKEQKKKVIDMNKSLEPKIKIDSNFIDNTTNIKHLKIPQSNLGTTKMSEEEIINDLRARYRKCRDEELMLEQKTKIYFEKLKEIDTVVKEDQSKEEQEKEEQEQEQEKDKDEKEDNEEEEENQIEFGIDEKNPFYTDNENNIPEVNIKFTSAQFNQYAYIIFKNFEARAIIDDEAYKKVIIPFNDAKEKYVITKVTYASNEYNIIVDEFTKIIMKALNTNNEYNFTIVRLFLGALLYNCDCDTSKLVEHLCVLFGYIKNYAPEEKKLIEKLKTKYRKETEKLVECLTASLFNEVNYYPYFSLFKMKDLLDKNEINLKDKYIEFLFYYMKKFNNPDSKIDELKFSLLNDIIPIEELIIKKKIISYNSSDKSDFSDNISNENIKSKNLQKEKTKSKKDVETDEKTTNHIKEESLPQKDNSLYKNKEKNEQNDFNQEKSNKKEEKEDNKDIENNREHMDKSNEKIDEKQDNNKSLEFNNGKTNNQEKINNSGCNSSKILKLNNEDNKNINNLFIKEKNKIKNNIKFNNYNNYVYHQNETDNENINKKKDNTKDNNTNKDNSNNKEIEKDNKSNSELNSKEKSDKTNKNKDSNINSVEESKKYNSTKNSIKKKYEKNEQNEQLTDKFNNIINKSNNTDKKNIIIKKDKNSDDKSNSNSTNNKNKKKENENNENKIKKNPMFNNETGKEENCETGNYNYEKKNKKEQKKNEEKKSNNSNQKINEDKEKKQEKKETKKNKENMEEESSSKNKKKNLDEEDKKEINTNDQNKEDEKSFYNDLNKDDNNSDTNINNEEDSITEITNEEYVKQIIESIIIIQSALDIHKTNFNDLMKDSVNTILICGKNYQYISIEEFNDKLISLGVYLTDIQLSCLCSKFSVPNELRLIDKKKFEKGLEDHLNGNFNIE